MWRAMVLNLLLLFGGCDLTEKAGDCYDVLTDSGEVTDSTCDGIDDDCDGYVDNGPFIVDDDPATPGGWFYDDDGDGYGEEHHSYTGCDAPDTGMTQQGGDCDDSDAAINPAAIELDDEIDNDCDDDTDEEFDEDGDGIIGRYDCDDDDPETYPGAEELCDGHNNDCDEFTDEGC